MCHDRFRWAAAIVMCSGLVASGCTRQSTDDGAAIASTARGTHDSTAPAKGVPTRKLTVFAGSGAMAALKEIGPLYEADSGIEVDITSGGSGSLLTQFVQEQFGDLYIPGSDDFMDKAEAKEAVLADTRTTLVYLVPCICVAQGNPRGVKGLHDLARTDLRVVLGEPKAVCIGDISEAVLREKGLWDKVQPKVASFGSSCEDVLNKLLLGEADVIIGWDSFAKQNPDKVEAIPIEAKSARVRNIPAAVIRWSTQREAAEALADGLVAALA